MPITSQSTPPPAQSYDLSEEEFNALLDQEVSLTESNLQDKIHIGVIGKVSCGKSSFLNAFFKVKKDEKLRFHVGAVSGVTTKPKIVSIGNDILVFDLPGLDDNNKQNSQVTLDRIKDVDIGILIVTGSSDSSQKANYDLLKEHCDLVYVVLNKVDEYAKKPKALEKVTEQWHQDLGLSSDEKIWHTCCDGYDPDDESEELSIFGVDDLREKVLADTHQALLDKKLKKITKEKALKLSKELEGKSIAAKKAVIGGVIAAVSAALIPGPSAAYITAAQITAILGIHFAYTDKIMSKKAALALIPFFAGQAAVSSVFLVALSIFPFGFGIKEIAAAVTAFAITLPMLSSINWLYKKSGSLDDKEQLGAEFNRIRKELANADLKFIMKQRIKGNRKPLDDLMNKFV